MNQPEISFELFPPKRPDGIEALLRVADKLAGFDPAFISVTYGAGGSSRERTLGVTSALAEIAPAAGHITCVGASCAEVDKVLEEYWAAGVKRIVALRGDPLEGIGAAYAPHEEGYAYADDLIRGAKKIADFDVSVGCYPETHPEARGLQDELDNLKRKIDAGADRAITQFFFEPEIFLRYRDAAADAGIDKPIVPGVMLQPNFKGLQKMAGLCGAFVPLKISQAYEGLDDDAPARDRATIDLVSEICTRLVGEGVNAFHFYTMNKSAIAMEVCRNLGLNKDRRAA
ncbi:MAG: methylenetetrahydrofolate reductase [NAD(P)H] [Parvularcula sp.]|uniref:methylenetetrahydrofolate reductase [NAD(P)H] n=1 Tax=Hyphococcus sp. TaxID=2038636 RepID=UPI000C3DA51D|nr:methylenetetrahydrofolate reductase [NAD(P)H] [Parvularcula sp.]